MLVRLTQATLRLRNGLVALVLVAERAHVWEGRGADADADVGVWGCGGVSSLYALVVVGWVLKGGCDLRCHKNNRGL